MRSNEYIIGVVLARINQGEFDTIISVYCKEYGKIEIKLRSARKITSKLAPLVAEPFALVRLKIVSGKQYYYVIGGEVYKRFKNISHNYIKMNSIARIFNSINSIVKLKTPDVKIFSLLITFLQKANSISPGKIIILISAFLIKFLSFLGYRPEIRMCVICQKKEFKKNPFFDFEKGGVVCGAHTYASENKKELSVSARALLYELLYKKFEYVLGQKYNKKDIQLVSKIINQFYHWQVDPSPFYSIKR